MCERCPAATRAPLSRKNQGGSRIAPGRRADRNGLGLPWSHRHNERIEGTTTGIFDAVRGLIETHSEITGRQRKMLLRMRRTVKGRAICRRLQRCRAWRRCCSPQCKYCGYLYRLWLAPQVISLAQDSAHCSILSLNLKEVDCGTLAGIDLKQEKDALRQRLRRAGIDAAIGNMEVAYKPKRDRWGVHAHIIIFGLRQEAYERILESLTEKRAVELQPLNEPLAQITYLFKYVTYYHHPSSPRPLPLPDAQLIELAAWRARSCFADHTILIGFQRRGIIVPVGAERG